MLQNEESVDVKEDLPKDVSNELTNHNNISPSSNNSNTNWNNDTWADGEFEPINEDTFTGTLPFCGFTAFPNNKIKK